MITLKWLKKWSYMFLWVAAGVIYLSMIDNWQVYAKPGEQVINWYENVIHNINPIQIADVSINAETSWNVLPETLSGDVEETEGEIMSVGDDMPPEESTPPEGENGQKSPGEEADQESSEEKEESTSANEESANEESANGKSENGEPETDPEEITDDGKVSYQTVEDDYFADAVFIGDSRTVGMFQYGGLEDIADFYASTGLNIYKLFNSEIVSVEGQKKKITVEEALSQNSYTKIYFMIGINEMGTGTVETFTAAYKDAVDHMLELQPDAIIYIQGIMKVTTERSQKGDYINNEAIEARNEALAQLADNERIFYLDANPELCDDSGGLIASYTFDGVHLKAQYIDIWKTYLKEHAVLVH